MGSLRYFDSADLRGIVLREGGGGRRCAEVLRLKFNVEEVGGEEVQGVYAVLITCAKPLRCRELICRLRSSSKIGEGFVRDSSGLKSLI